MSFRSITYIKYIFISKLIDFNYFKVKDKNLKKKDAVKQKQ